MSNPDIAPSGRAVRLRAAAHFARGQAGEALRLLKAFETELEAYRESDDDDDASWYRNEAIRWERWATTRALAFDDTADEQALKHRLLEAKDVNPTTVRRAFGKFERDDANEWLDRIDLARRVATRLSGRAAMMTAVVGLALVHGVQKGSELPTSSRRDDVAEEQATAIEGVIAQAIESDASLRVLLRKVLAGETPELGARIRRIAGPGGAEEVAELQARYAKARSDKTRFELAIELIYHYADFLEHEELLDLARAHNLHEAAVSSLLAWGRVDEAWQWAERTAAPKEGSHPASHDIRSFAEIFLAARQPALAERIVTPYAKNDAILAEVLVRALAAQPGADAMLAAMSWFKQRPTQATYDAIVALVPVARGVLTPPSPPKPIAAAPASPPKSAAAPPSHVEHPKFGRGRVLRVEGSGSDRKYTIDFGCHGTKTLLARFVTTAD